MIKLRNCCLKEGWIKTIWINKPEYWNRHHKCPSGNFTGEIDTTSEFETRMIREEYNQSLFLAENTIWLEKAI